MLIRALIPVVLLSLPAFAGVKLVADYNHQTMAARDAAIQAAARLGGNRRCLFVEVPPNFNGAMSLYASGRAPYAGTVGAAAARYQQEMGMQFFNVVPESFLSQAAAAGVRVYGVDVSENSAAANNMKAAMTGMGPYFGRETQAPPEMFQKFVRMLDQRSGIMSANIARLIRAGTCAESVLVVGEAHLRAPTANMPMTPISTRLAGYGISTYW